MTSAAEIEQQLPPTIAPRIRSVRLADQTPWKMWRIGSDGLLEAAARDLGVDEAYNAPRQLLPLAYWQDGYVDICRPRTVLAAMIGRM